MDHDHSVQTNRILQYYRHLFPDLFGETNGVIEPNPVAAQSHEVALEDARRGWDSQPKEFDYFLDVIGELPKELHGSLFRNGPGLLEVYGTPLVHPIDGDGMICRVSFNNGKAHFKSSFVKTSSYVQEKKEQRMIYRGAMGTNPPEGPLDMRFKNPSNTNVYYWGGKLMSVYESGWPYRLNPHTLETIGKDDLGGVLTDAKSLGAHGRYDAVNKRMVTFSMRNNPDCKSGSVWIYEFDEQFNCVKKRFFNLPQYHYCHDLLITPKYYLIFQSCFYAPTEDNINKILEGTAGPGQLMRYYPEIPCKFLVISRDCEHAPVREFKTEPGHVYHHINAFEDGKKIILESVVLGENFNMDFEDKVSLSNGSVSPGEIYAYQIDLEKNTISRNKSDRCSCEFPTIHPDLNGKQWRYSYVMAADAPHKFTPYQEVVKHDRLGTNRQVWSSRGEYGIIGEPVFIPRPGSTEEDDGWVVTQEYLCREHKTQYVVLDAKDLAKGPIARLPLKHHTPYGFHGTFHDEVFV